MDPDALTIAGRILLDAGGLLFGLYLATVGGAWSLARLRRARAHHAERATGSSRPGAAP